MRRAPQTCILSKGRWRSGIASGQYVASLNDTCPKECTSNLELSIERFVVVVFNYAASAARCQGNTKSERHCGTAGDATRIRQKASGGARAGL